VGSKYGLLGLGRDRGPVLSIQQEYMVNTLSIYKFRLINVHLTRDLHYVAQLRKFEDIAFNFRLLHGHTSGASSPAAAARYTPTFKSYQFVASAVVRNRGGAVAARTMEAFRCEAKDLLEPGTDLARLSVEDRALVEQIVAWVRKKAKEDMLRARRRQQRELGLDVDRPEVQLATAEESTDDDDDDADDADSKATVRWDAGGFEDLTSTLFAHQRAAVRWMMKVERSASLQGGILADEMGLGKTVTMLALLCGGGGARRAATAAPSAASSGGSKRRPTLIVLPLSLLQQWKREIDTHTRGLTTVSQNG
jgi:hypothetical protein